MSTAHSAALRKHWSDPAYRAKQAKSRQRTEVIDALTEEIAHWHDDEGETWQFIAARTHMCVAAVRRRYDKAKMARLTEENAELQRQLGEVSAQLSLVEEGVEQLRVAWHTLCADDGTTLDARNAFDSAALALIGEP